ncbi:hypothetical protein ACH5RR_020388 [Cinchona calisaya]|uniref:Uncharacterized protein n=1 Tax=Cinchona calisaya TaxID=153742 RepID=A0ABD2ZEA2_9GENT
MGVSTKEKGVLKLVHPGRHVEKYREPITAAEIMSKYPRHCIARPDVFKFPYIVVRPESLLFPGKVFYLVPNRTLYNLLKAREQQNQPSLRENQYPHNHDHHRYSTRKTPSKCRGGITPKQQQHGHRKRLSSMLHDRTNSHDQDSEDYYSDTSYVDTWTEITDRIKRASYKSYQPSPAASSVDSCIPFFSRGSHSRGHSVTSTLSIVKRGHNVTLTLPTVTNGGKQTRSLGDNAKPKSCFRKQDSERKSLNLGVTFASPIIIPGSPVGSSSPKQTVGACKQYNLRL